MMQQPMNPMMMKLMQMMAMQQPQQPPEMMPGAPDLAPDEWGSDSDMQEYYGQPFEPGLGEMQQGVPQMAGNFGPIGQRMERMRPTLVHDRKKVQGMFPKGIPEDVEGATREMEGAPDEMSQIGAHKKQHKFMKGHLKAGIGRIQAERSGESVDQMFQKLQGDLQKLKEQRAKRGK